MPSKYLAKPQVPDILSQPVPEEAGILSHTSSVQIDQINSQIKSKLLDLDQVYDKLAALKVQKY